MRLLTLLILATLSACASANQTAANSPGPVSEVPAPITSPASTPPATPASTLNVGLFSMDELFAQGGGGCGLTLWKQEDGPRPPGYLFYNRLAQKPGDEFALMKIDGKFVRFRRTAATGQEFYGQRTSQTFVSQDGTIQLQVDVTLGQPGEIESVGLQGSLRGQHNGTTVNISVRGDAGC